MNALELVAGRFARSADTPFFTSLSDRTFTYADYWDAAASLADHWRGQGCRPGDVIAFLLPNDFALPCCYLSCAIGGYVACPIPPQHHPDLVRKLLDLVSPKLVVREIPPAAPAAPGKGRPGIGILPGQDRPFLILFTSGLTGEPKAICHSFRNIIGSAAAFADLTGMSEGTRLYHVFPMAYMAGILNAFFAPFTAGASIVEGPMFSPASALDLVSRPLAMGANTLSLTPTMASALCRMAGKITGRDEFLTRVVQVQCTSAPIPPGLQEEFLRTFGLPLQNCYGMTELGGPLTFQSLEDARQLRDLGMLVRGLEVSLRGDTGHDLWIRSPYTMLGYLREGRLESPLDEGGFLDTGDLADQEGQKIRITGRKKDIIIRGGVNVSPARVEMVLEGMDEVSEVAVVGIPHPFWGEAIVACIVPAVGHPDVQSKAAVHSRGHLSPHERPDFYVLMDRFPRSFIGKLERKKLRETAIQEIGARGKGEDH